MSDLRAWVNDQLHSVLGYAEGHTVDYVLSLAKSAKTPQALLAKLADADVPSNSTTQRFAVDLFNRVPRGSAAPKVDAAREQRKETIAMLKKNEQYGMVSDGDDDDGGEAEAAAAVQRALQEKEKERKRERKRARAEEKAGGKKGAADDAGGGPSGATTEEQRDADLRERDEFAERLRLRDLERTKKLDTGPEAEALARRQAEAERLTNAKTAEEKAAALAEARKVSRRVDLEGPCSPVH